MPSLDARLVVSTGTQLLADNLLPPEHTAVVEFTDPPPAAKNVVVRIMSKVNRYSGTHPGNQLGRFLGHFQGGMFVVDEVVAAPLNESLPNVFISAGQGAGKATFSAVVPNPRDVISHTLTLNIQAPDFDTVDTQHQVHVGNLGVAMVFSESRLVDGNALRGYAEKISRNINGKRWSYQKQTIDSGATSFGTKDFIVGQVQTFHEKSGTPLAELHVVGHTNNGLDFKGEKEAEVLAKHSIENVEIVWHGCYACNFFDDQRKARFFKSLPHATIYGHRNMKVQAGMPWGFVRIRKDGEVDVQNITAEVVPRSYVLDWVDTETDENLELTLKAPQCEADVKKIVEDELALRKSGKKAKR
ncbi:MAG: hypothetical protein HOV80_13195 [Polyangiaceae bacterium]|nr:hypothetical protein [Polyangiaceae bacterium]